MHKTYLGIDLGGTKTALVLGDATPRVHKRIVFPTRAERGPQAIIDEIIREGERLLAEHDIVAAGVSCGAPLDPVRGLVQSPPNLPGWDDIPLRDLLQQAWRLPVAIRNDANAGALAEWRYGSGRGTKNFIFLTFGTGLGAGLILNGELYEGTSFLAGEVGHVRIAEDGPVGHGKAGSFEAFCSGPGLQRLARWRPEAYGKEIAELSTEEITRRAHAGNPACVQLVADSGRYLGRGLAMLVDVLNPQVIAIGSMALRLGDLLLEPARQVVRQEALPGAAEVCRIVPAELGESIGDLAALCVAMAANAAG